MFRRPLSPDGSSADLEHHQQEGTNISNEMGIQRRPQRSLLDLIESQPGKEAPRKSTGKSTQPKLPPPPPPQPSLPPRPELVDPKRKREQKGKDIVEVGKSGHMPEEEIQGASKQQRVDHTGQRGPEKREPQVDEPQAWLPAPMLHGEPLRDNASIKDFHGGDGCHIASALEEALLLFADMAKLWSGRKNEAFLNLKR